jgi:hypothetical protein
MGKLIKNWIRKIVEGIRHRQRLRKIQKQLDKGEDPFSY